MKISRHGTDHNSGEFDLVDRDEPGLLSAGNGGVTLRYFRSHDPYTDLVDGSHHDYTVELSQDDLRIIFNALIEAAGEADPLAEG